MKKALAAVLLATVAVAVWAPWSRTRLQVVKGQLSSSADESDRVAVARQRHGAAIQEKFRAAGVAYPGGVFLRWLKREAVLELWAQDAEPRFRLVSSYPILASSGEPGPKRREGDSQVPEGFYEIDRFNPASAFHLSLGLNYPNAADRVLSDHEQPGSDIFIHGGNASIGCAPVGDEAVEEVYLAALDARAHGQARIEVHIFPGRMAGAEWEHFAANEIARRPELAASWVQLQPAFEFFEHRHRLPSITVAGDGRYTVLGD